MIGYGISFDSRLRAIAERARALRIRRGFRQDELAERAGVGVATIVRFEKNGHASLETVMHIAVALNAEDMFDRLFEAPEFATIDEALAEAEPKKRRRVRSP